MRAVSFIGNGYRTGASMTTSMTAVCSSSTLTMTVAPPRLILTCSPDYTRIHLCRGVFHPFNTRAAVAAQNPSRATDAKARLRNQFITANGLERFDRPAARSPALAGTGSRSS